MHTDNQIKSVATKTDQLIDGFALTNTKIDNVQDLVVCMTDSLKSAHSKISDNVNKLTEVSTRVDQNKNDILITTKKQEELERLMLSHWGIP